MVPYVPHTPSPGMHVTHFHTIRPHTMHKAVSAQSSWRMSFMKKTMHGFPMLCTRSVLNVLFSELLERESKLASTGSPPQRLAMTGAGRSQSQERKTQSQSHREARCHLLHWATGARQERQQKRPGGDQTLAPTRVLKSCVPTGTVHPGQTHMHTSPHAPHSTAYAQVPTQHAANGLGAPG